jgi:signal peptidase I
MRKEDANTFLKKLWYFVWHEDSAWSWIVNVALAFLIVKFLVFPGLGFALSTSHPVVAVVSGSMEHDGSFDDWWGDQGVWYAERGIDVEQFKKFSFKNGFNKGDIMVLRGKDASSISVGDVLVFQGGRPDPVIHRVVQAWEQEGVHFFQTKGDHNPDSIAGGFAYELEINEDRIIGVAVMRVPLLGWVKIGFVELINMFR